MAALVQNVLLPSLQEETALVVEGIDLLTVFKSIDAVRLLIGRVCRHSHIPADENIILHADNSISLGMHSIAEAVVIGEISSLCASEDCAARPIGQRLATWILQALRDNPCLLPGFDGKVDDQGDIVLTSDQSSDDEHTDIAYLARRWSGGDLILLSAKETLRREQERNEPVRKAVADVLLPSLTGEGRRLADEILKNGHSADIFYAATQAISMLIRRADEEESQEPLILAEDGSIRQGDAVIVKPEHLAIEVARFTDLWENPAAADEDLKPDADAYSLVRWIVQALKDQPQLLPHFKWQPETGALIEVPPSERINDPAQRWAKKAENISLVPARLQPN
jgi:hypothetical protein